MKKHSEQSKLINTLAFKKQPEIAGYFIFLYSNRKFIAIFYIATSVTF